MDAQRVSANLTRSRVFVQSQSLRSHRGAPQVFIPDYTGHLAPCPPQLTACFSWQPQIPLSTAKGTGVCPFLPNTTFSNRQTLLQNYWVSQDVVQSASHLRPSLTGITWYTSVVLPLSPCLTGRPVMNSQSISLQLFISYKHKNGKETWQTIP